MNVDILNFIKSCIRRHRILWTYHVNMRLKERLIPRKAILSSLDSYEIIEVYPEDKYLPSHLVEEKTMICHNCGKKLENIVTNLPFKIGHDRIVIVKGLPVLQCQNCNEYLIEDSVMEKVDSILDQTDKTAELEVLSYAV